jgi:hypothetical protein
MRIVKNSIVTVVGIIITFFVISFIYLEYFGPHCGSDEACAEKYY